MKHVKTSYNGKKMILVTYNSSILKNKDKVRFYYALKGRNGISGIIKHYNIEFLGKGVLLIPFKHEKNIREFFTMWDLPYTLKEISLEKGEDVFKGEEEKSKGL